MSLIQLTYALRQHQLTNAQVWSADSQWIVCDFRSSTTVFDSPTVEKVSVNTGEAHVLYRATANAYVGVVTANPRITEQFVCIHSPEHPDEQWQYDFHHRRGVIIENQQAITLDAMDITPPFTAGALRGGSHVHMFSPDGSRLSFTYNDHVMHEYSLQEDLRNVGVAVPLTPVKVKVDHPREYSGGYFCVLVSSTNSRPDWGSDQISRAYEEAWIGERGYQKIDGSWQRWALAFIGDTRSVYGELIPEVFIVDLPDSLTDYARPGKYPLAGTTERLPSPPAGIKQRRLTYSQGIALQPRHWLKSSPDGRHIAFLMADQQAVVQLWTISPLGGNPVQHTTLISGVSSAFTWHPQGTHLTFVSGDQIMVHCLATGMTNAVTPVLNPAPCAEAVVWSPDGKKITFMRPDNAGYRQLWLVHNPLSDDIAEAYYLQS